MRPTASLFSRFLFAALLAAAVPATAWSGPVLERVSFTERSDGDGMVVRFHLSERTRAFSGPQTVADGLLEIVIFNTDIAGRPEFDAPAGPIRAYDAHRDGRDVRVSLALAGSAAHADLYRDRDSNDLLLTVDAVRDGPPAYRVVLGPPAPEDQRPAETPPGVGPGSEFAADRWKIDTIVIDAGHGGKDTGALGHRGLREKDVVLSVALKLGHYLEELLGVNVVYTRDDDRFIDLHERGAIANQAGAKLFVSIHANSARSSQAHGTETFFLGMHRTESARSVMERENSVIALEDDQTYYDKYDQAGMVRMQLAQSAFMRKSEGLAALVQEQFTERVQRRNRGVKQAGFVVLYEAAMPSILVELGFVTNAREAAFLRSDRGQDYLASAIFRAIRDYKQATESELGVVSATSRGG